MLRQWLAALACLLAACTCAPSGGVKPSTSASPDAERLLHGDEALREKLAAALAAKGPDYVPRTKHKKPDGTPKYLNRLILETSPYLLQHAHNPVNWFPWGDEAFEVAKKLNRPVFLSVGYSTCHWCHVMEEESFEDEEIARFLNDHYVCIKVDREERPDVDAIYMRSVQLMTQRGGWPMSVWLTPDRQPFYAGSYFPPRDGERGQAKGFLTIAREQHKAYADNPSGVTEDARAIAESIRRDLEPARGKGLPEAAVITRAVEMAEKRYDTSHGGTRGRPKFPSNFPVRLLLRHALRHGSERSREMALTTLGKMHRGGLYDHVGGGFHRYSVDERWLVPHFEKMLYDNAILATTYLEGFLLSGDGELARVARATLDYVVREMTAPEGAYYSATDADSLTPAGKREEGYYFTWTPAELDAVLGAERSAAVKGHFGVTEKGNFEGRSVLATTEAGRPEKLDEALALLLAARNKRPKPLRDEKILVAWNGLMIGAMARGARVLGERRYLESGARAARFLLDKLVVGGRLRHSFKDGKTGTLAFAEDHAFLAAGLLELYQASGELRWLSAALARMEALEKHHADREHGGYYRGAADGEKLLAREIEMRDGPVPSAGSVAALVALELATITGDERWRARAEKTLRAAAPVLESQPYMLEDMLLALDYHSDSPKEVLLALPAGMTLADEAVAALAAPLRTQFVPNHVLVVASEEARKAGLERSVPWADAKVPKNGKPTAYVCERGRCELPTTDPVIFGRQLKQPVSR